MPASITTAPWRAPCEVASLAPLLAVLCLWVGACEGAASGVAQAAPRVSDATEKVATGSTNPLSAHGLAASERFEFTGRITRRLPAGGYVYLRVHDDHGRAHWVATLRATAPEAQRVRVWVLARAARFPSRRLQREFAPLLFAAVHAHADPHDHPRPKETP